MSIYSTEVQKLYVAYFGRPADPAGLAYFAAQANDLTEVAGVFSHSAEAKVLYNASTAAQIVEAIYQNLFGRGPEPAGLTFWTRQIESGSTTSGNAAIEILLSAKNDDALTVDNKLQAAQAFTDAIDTAEERAGYAGAAATDIARQFLSTITSSPSSLDNLAERVAKAVADATGTGRPTPPVDPSPWVPVFSASFTNGTFTFSNPGEELSFAVTGSNPLVYTFASTGTVSGTSAVIVTSAVSDIVVPTGKVLSITEDDFLDDSLNETQPVFSSHVHGEALNAALADKQSLARLPPKRLAWDLSQIQGRRSHCSPQEVDRYWLFAPR